MDEPSILMDVGGRLRVLRQRRGLSLRDLAAQCDLSVNTISLIERGQMAPSVVTLHKLSTALGVKITAFFDEPGERSVVFVKAAERSRVRGSGIIMENLGSGLAGQSMELLRVSLEPGATSDARAVTHPGHEFLYCLEGALEYEINGRLYEMLPGDSLLFEAQLPHRWRNPADALATALLIFQGDQDRDESIQSHLAPAGAARHGPR